MIMIGQQKELIKKLNIQIPETWDEFISTAKLLARNNMDVWMPYTQITAVNQVNTGIGSLNIFSSLLLQNNLSLYAKDGRKTNLTETEVIKVFELENVLNHKLTGISKGEIQRVLLAFSILYGSKSIFMDEPMFAMEDRQKHSAMAFIKKYSKENNVPVFIAMHELDLSKKYADNVLLFYPDRRMDYGTPEEVLTKEALEEAYGVPAAMLRDTENLNRNALKEASETLADVQKK